MRQDKRRQLAAILPAAVMAVFIGTLAFPEELLVTGQTTAFQADKNDGITGPVAVADDGTLELGLPLQYTNTGLTVIDPNTCLEWEKKNNKNGVEDFSNLHDADNAYFWSGNGTQETIWDWINDVNAQQFAGHNDWRIPNLRELESTVHYGRSSPAVDPIFGPTHSIDYWTSTTRKGFTTTAWTVDLGQGGNSFILKNTAKRVRAVRGGECLLVTGQTTVFQADMNDGITGPVAVPDDGTLQLGLPLQYIDTGLTVIDLNTGLEWEKKDSNDGVQNPANRHDADNVYLWSGDGTQETIWDWLDNVNAEQFAGYSDWGIPNLRELESIVHYGRQTPAIDPIFGPTAIHTYWSSTTQHSKQSQSFGINFENGKTLVLLKANIFKWVRAVRTANQLPVNQAPAVNAGADQTITLPNAATLDGTVTDDGLPSPPTLTTTWSKVSGPGTVTFGNANAVDTTATFSVDGVYVLRLTASDGALSTSDDISITVNPASPTNQAPVVNAGADQTITLPNAATLDGTVTDDGLPSPPALTTTWSKVSGLGTVTFGNANAVDTTATFSVDGVYVLRLTASDGALSTSDDISITVNPASPTNQAPAVNAGADQTITLPNAATLDGTVTDDGLPSPPALTTTWSKVSGLGTVTFGNANAVDTTATFSVDGVYVLRLTASDGALSTSDDISITVNPASPTNQAPVVNAGADQTMTALGSVNLDGTVTDDGVPNPPGAFSTTWTEVSGPGTVNFGSASSVDTTASFSQMGAYVLRLTASDGELTSFDEVTITVDAAPGDLVVGYGFEEGAGTTTQDWSGNENHGTLTNEPTWLAGQMGLGLSFDGVNDYVETGNTVDLPTWTLSAWVMSPGAPLSAASSGPINRGVNYQINWNHTDEAFRGAVAVQVGGTWYTASFGPLAANIWYYLAATYDGETLNAYKDGVLITSNTTPSGPPNSEPNSLKLGGTPELPGFFQGTLDEVRVYNRALSEAEIQNDMLTPVAPSANQAPAVNAGADQTITLPNAATLDGTVTDDGLPSPPALTTTWSKVSGPGTVTFGNANAVDTTATFSVDGVYVLRLTASDGALSTSDDISITVNPASPTNQAPVVNAGADQTITLPNAATLDGTVTDDGLPSPPTLTTTWSKVSGPGTVTFGNANAVDTTATFSVDGVYVLRLTASDGALSTSDDISITVNPASPTNQAPAVNAGADQTITLPNAATLDGTVTDDGLPSPPALTTTWSKVSGLGTVTFGNANAVDTTATFSVDGVYVLRLTASDGALSTSDDISITVNPASPGNQPPVAEANGPYSGKRNVTIAFSSAGSVDPDGSIVGYSWNFGDGSPPSTAPNPSHIYTSIGNFTATLTVTDNQGVTGSDTAPVKVTR